MKTLLLFFAIATPALAQTSPEVTQSEAAALRECGSDPAKDPIIYVEAGPRRSFREWIADAGRDGKTQVATCLADKLLSLVEAEGDGQLARLTLLSLMHENLREAGNLEYANRFLAEYFEFVDTSNDYNRLSVAHAEILTELGKTDAARARLEPLMQLRFPGVSEKRLFLALARLAAAEGNDAVAAREYTRVFELEKESVSGSAGYLLIGWLDLADTIARHGDEQYALSAYKWIATVSSFMGPGGNENREDRPNFAGRLAMDRMAKIYAKRGDRERARYFAIPALIDAAYNPKEPRKVQKARELAYEMEQLGADLFSPDAIEYKWAWQLRLAFFVYDGGFQPPATWLKCGAYPLGDPEPEPEAQAASSGRINPTVPQPAYQYSVRAPAAPLPPPYQTPLDEQIDTNRLPFNDDIIPQNDRDGRLLLPYREILAYSNVCLSEGLEAIAYTILDDHVSAMSQAGYGGLMFKEMADLRATLATQSDDFEFAEREYLAVIDDLLSRPEGFEFKDLHSPFFSLVSVYERYGRWDRAEALALRMMNIPIGGTGNTQRVGLRGLEMWFAPNFHMLLIDIYLKQGKADQARGIIAANYPDERPIDLSALSDEAFAQLEGFETEKSYKTWLSGQAFLAETDYVGGNLVGAIRRAQAALNYSEFQGNHISTRSDPHFYLMPWEEEADVRETLGRLYLADRRYDDAVDLARQSAIRRIFRQIERENAEEAGEVYRSLGYFAEALAGSGDYGAAGVVVRFADAIFDVRDTQRGAARKRGESELAAAGTAFLRMITQTVPTPEKYESGNYTHNMLRTIDTNPGFMDRFGPVYASFLVSEEGRITNLNRLSRETTTSLTGVRMQLAENGQIGLEEGLSAGENLLSRLEAQWSLSQSTSFDTQWQLRNLINAPQHYLRQASLRWKAEAEGGEKADREEVFRLLQRGSYNVVDLTLNSAIAHGLFREKSPELIELLDRRNEQLMTYQLVISAMSQNEFAALEAQVSLTPLLEELEAIDAQIAKDHSDYLEFMKADPMSIAEAQALLKPSEALLMLIPTSGGTHGFVITPNSTTWKLLEIDKDGVTRGVRRLLWFAGGEIEPTGEGYDEWIEGTDGGLSGYDRDAAFALYSKLIAPLMGELQGSEQVFLAPSGALATLPFGMLVREEPQGRDDNPDDLRATAWLAEAFPMVQVPSFNSFASLRRYVSDDTQAVDVFRGFGAPILSDVESDRSDRGRKRGGQTLSANLFQREFGSLADVEALRAMSSLKNTETELREMARALGADEDRTLLLAGDLTEETIRAMDLSDTRILAFATHALVADDSSGFTEPGLVLTPPETASPANDGYLSASEIAALDLNALWVVLSACNTAAGDPSTGAPGLSGLVRAFFHAGARNLLASHWVVDDEIASKLTVRIVEIGRDNPSLSRAAAFQQAMREIRENPKHDGVNRFGFEESWAHPSQWAPFSLIGAGG
ncbi:hypothetical protein EH31_05410 [Erythrobacter longus]|uniref:CHAT domain-containing protein n=2 Tax=Erythrobacter longus TaxID=1044 RepID=A0A074MBG0_ERYLO|nr:hypothetical protein EH31_05410 [Erythrobacter longus]